MPGFDGTGPAGAGSMTGGARGFCNPSGVRDPKSFGKGMGLRGSIGGYGAGMGMRRGFGRGFGRCRGFLPAYGSTSSIDTTAELDMLKAQADSMQNALDDINSRMAQLQKKAAE
jgi:hypothetical protein